MTDMLMPIIPREERYRAAEQLHKLEEKGCEHGKPFSAYETFLQVLNEYENKHDSWSEDERKNYLFTAIAAALTALPAYGLQEYISTPRPLELEFTSSPPREKNSLHSKGLGRDFILAYVDNDITLIDRTHPSCRLENDCHFIRSFLEVRTRDFKFLLTSLCRDATQYVGAPLVGA